MNKQDLRFSYLGYFAGQYAKREDIDFDTLENMAAGDSDLERIVLKELINEGLIEGIDVFEDEHASRIAQYSGKIKLTAKGLKEILNIFPEEKKEIIEDIKSDIENQNKKILTVEDLLNKEKERISKLSDKEKEEEIKIKILEYFQYLNSEINKYENKQIKVKELKENLKQLVSHYFDRAPQIYASNITKKLMSEGYITYLYQKESLGSIDIDKLLTNKAKSYLVQLEKENNERLEQYCKEHNIKFPKINIPIGAIKAYQNIANPALIAAMNQLPAIYSSINNFGLSSTINQITQVQSTLNTPYVNNVLNNLKSPATEAAIKSAQKGLSEILNSPPSGLYAKLIEQVENNLDIPKTTFKIKKIIINNFKNLKNINIDFTNTNNLLFIIGNNASGKSNILEAISAIFTEVYTNKKKPNFEYELIYQINANVITIKRSKNSHYYKLNNMKSSKKQIIQKDLLPSKIIALYSGEEMRLWDEYYKKFYHKYLKDLTSAKFDTSGDKMIYINKKYWDISLLTLLLSDSNDNKNFIRNKLNIDIKTVQVNINFNSNFINSSKGEELKDFIKIINPQNHNTISVKLSTLKNRIFPKYKGEKENYIEKYSLKKVFEILAYALMPKSKKAFKNIEIIFNNGLSIKSLSEGEKKYILIYAIIDVLADEKTLILMDEPDAHIHEVGKKIICNLFEKYSSEFGRQIIVTTHSPTLTHCLENNHLVMLENKNGYSAVINHEKIDKIKNLTGGIWSETKQNIFLNSTTPLILFEGIGDITYVKTAINLFKSEFPLLENVDFLPFGGAANACEFAKDIKEIVNKEKKIIMIFDRDDAGQDGMGKCLPKGVFKEGVKNTKTYLNKDNGIIYLMLPMSEERKSMLTINAKDKDLHFLIEDCFSNDLRKDIAQKCINETNGIFNKYTKDLKGHIKTILSRPEYHTPENMSGFKNLLIKIQNIIKGLEPLEEVQN